MTTHDPAANFPALKALSEIIGAISPLEVEDAHDGTFRCPLCDDGTIDAEQVATLNGSPSEFPIGAVGVQCFGIGDGHGVLERALRDAPKEIAALLAKLAAAEAERDEVRKANVAQAISFGSEVKQAKEECVVLRSALTVESANRQAVQHERDSLIAQLTGAESALDSLRSRLATADKLLGELSPLIEYVGAHYPFTLNENDRSENTSRIMMEKLRTFLSTRATTKQGESHE